MKKTIMEKMEESFRTPLCSKRTVLARARRLIPHYAVLNSEQNAYVCTYCGKEVQKGKIQHNKKAICQNCGSVVTVNENRFRTDNLWVFTPGVNEHGHFGSYWHYVQTVDRKGKVTAELREEARYLSPDPHTRYCFVKDGDTWQRRKSPFFVRTRMGLRGEESPDWCERNYIVPKQYARVIGQMFPLLGEIAPCNSKLWDRDDHDLWGLCYDQIKAYNQNVGMIDYLYQYSGTFEAKKPILEKLKAFGLYYLFWDYLHSTDERSMTRCPDSRGWGFNAQGTTVEEFLGLSAEETERFMKTNRTAVALHDILKKDTKEQQPAEERLLPEESEYRHCLQLAARSIEREGLSYTQTFIVPEKCHPYRWFYLTLAAAKSGRKIRISEKRSRTPGFRVKPFVSKGSLEIIVGGKGKIPEELTSSPCMRRGMFKYPEALAAALTYERLEKAGFTMLTKEIKRCLADELNPTFVVKNANAGKLYSCLGIPRRMFSALNREIATGKLISAAQQAFSVCDYLSPDDFMLYKIMYPGAKLEEGLLRNGQNIHDTIRYFKENAVCVNTGIHPHEYVAYIDEVRTVYGKVNRKNAFPADFQEAQKKVHELYMHVKRNINADAMKKISDALRNDKTVTRFFQKHKEYLIFVPESPEELIREGQRLHNCLSTYDERVANGNTSVFFMRMADAPDTAFVAFEVRDGVLLQIHGNMNSNVNEDVRNYANEFVRVLNKISFNPKKIIAA